MCTAPPTCSPSLRPVPPVPSLSATATTTVATAANSAEKTTLFASPVPLPSGRASSVFLAVHAPTGIPVAVKTYLKRDLLRRGGRLARRVQVERAALARVRAPQLLAATHDARTVALVMARAPGISLARLVALQHAPPRRNTSTAVTTTDTASASGCSATRRKSSRSGVVSVREAARAVVHALERIHAAGVMHLDLTLENVVVDVEALRRGGAESQAATVVDFGSAELEDDPEPDRDYAETATVDILPPELVDSTGPPTRAADVWALGVCVFRMLTGKPSPFRGGGDYAVLQRIAARTPGASLPFGDDNHDGNGHHINALAKDFVHRCLHPDPASRLGVVATPADGSSSSSQSAWSALTVDYDEIRKHPFLAPSAAFSSTSNLSQATPHPPVLAI